MLGNLTFKDPVKKPENWTDLTQGTFFRFAHSPNQLFFKTQSGYLGIACGIEYFENKSTRVQVCQVDIEVTPLEC